jgi:hypothetical protein
LLVGMADHLDHVDTILLEIPRNESRDVDFKLAFKSGGQLGAAYGEVVSAGLAKSIGIGERDRSAFRKFLGLNTTCSR